MLDILFYIGAAGSFVLLLFGAYLCIGEGASGVLRSGKTIHDTGRSQAAPAHESPELSGHVLYY